MAFPTKISILFDETDLEVASCTGVEFLIIFSEQNLAEKVQEMKVTIPSGTIFVGTIPGDPPAKEDSKAGKGDEISKWIVNMWALMPGSHKPTPGACV